MNEENYSVDNMRKISRAFSGAKKVLIFTMLKESKALEDIINRAKHGNSSFQIQLEELAKFAKDYEYDLNFSTSNNDVKLVLETLTDLGYIAEIGPTPGTLKISWSTK